MADVEIKRGYEVLSDNNVRFGIRVINNSSFAISDVEVILDYSEDSFKLQGDRIGKLGTIPPSVPRTAKFVLQPKGCIHKEELGATVLYKDHEWNKHVDQMRPKEVHCVCPFLKEKSISRAEFLTLSKSGYSAESGVNFENIDSAKVVDFLSHTCKNRLYKVDEFPVDGGSIIYMAGDAVGEKAYYLLTAVVKEHERLTQVFLRANSDKDHGLTGFLNETLDNLRHLVVVGKVREIGVLKKEQVINIIDSVVQRTTFGGVAGEGGASVNIQDSVVQRTEFDADEDRRIKEEAEGTKREEECLHREHEQRAREAQENKERREDKTEQEYFRKIKVQDETWIGCALLHYENPERLSFTVKELVDRVSRENIYGKLRPGIKVHAYLHNIANKTPNPGKYRLLYATSDNKRRLYRDIDDYHPLRKDGKTVPTLYDIPEEYHYLIYWYENVYNKPTADME